MPNQALLWMPSASRMAASVMQRFLSTAQQSDPSIKSYADLHRWSINDGDAFWRRLFDFSDIVHSGDPTPTMQHRRMPFAGFFPKVRLNYAENLTRHRSAQKTALVSLSEARPAVRLSQADLYAEVVRVRTALRHLGVKAGDRVAGFMPNIAETVTAMLATASLGAVWSSCSPDFGAQGAIDRFGQITPKILVVPNGYTYHGKSYGCLDKAADIARGIPTVSHVLVVPLCDALPKSHEGLQNKQVLWQDLPQPAEGASDAAWERFAFETPLYILYSSGTTGIPKCIVHGAGGSLLQHVKELSLHSDVRPDDNLLYFTTCGWMMWNWMVSALHIGATVTLYDGSPTAHDTLDLFTMAADEGVTHLGTSAKYLATCRQANPAALPPNGHLRVVLSTGSPLGDEEFDWVYRHLPDVQLSSISGGTDIVSCFVLGNPLLGVYRGEIQCMGLGMDVAAWDSDHRAVLSAKGELVCRKPFVSMPVGFWNDPDGVRYKATYFHEDAKVWFHGDTIAITQSQGDVGGIVMYGRSDATLKPGGVRIGTAEIYRLVEALPMVEDSVVIGQPYQGDVRVVLFVKVAPNHVWSDEAVRTIKQAIRAGATPRHVPQVILPVEKIPYTRSGKKMELAVLDIVCHREPKNREAMQDPTALDGYRDLPALNS